MSKARQQSLQRAIRRGNAFFFFNRVIQSIDVCRRKGTPASVWKHNVKNRVRPEELGIKG